jgi:hypothetical protein
MALPVNDAPDVHFARVAELHSVERAVRGAFAAEEARAHEQGPAVLALAAVEVVLLARFAEREVRYQ